MPRSLSGRIGRLTALGLVGAVALVVGPRSRVVADPAPDALATEYATTVRPLLTTYCQKCHSANEPEADLNLSKFATLADVKKATRVWQKVGEFLDSHQMPPKDAKQPTDAERARLKTWVRSHLKAEAKAHAGDPGRVVLRRLSNAEYTYTLRDLTGVASLDPAKEFPIDGAAGEGFTNTGDALVMSPALLTKYLDAAKGVAGHAVFLPDGMRFSAKTTRQDWTNEILDQIRQLYQTYSDASGGSKVALQGLVWDGKEGGRLPVEKYIAATLAERDALRAGSKTTDRVAADRGLSARYLDAVWRMFTGSESSPLLDDLRARWRAAGPGDASALMAEITRWQNAVWKFSPIGHIGKVGGPKAWLEPVDPLVTRHDIRFPVPADATGDVKLHLVATDCGDGNAGDFVVWERPRFVAPGRPDLLLKDVRAVARDRLALRAQAFSETVKYLQAADEAAAAKGAADVAALAKAHALNPAVLNGWLDLLGIGTSGPVKLTGHYTTRISNAGKHTFVNGWGSDATPLLVVNSSDNLVRIPGDLKGHGVAVHPSPTLNAVVGWRSPVAGTIRVEPKIQHAHPGCGNGIVWAVEVRRGATRQRLAAGPSQGTKVIAVEPIDKLPVSVGDVVSVVIGPRDGNHACDLTAVDLTITADGKTWDLAKDITPDVHAGNPHADRYGNAGVWHFYTEPTSGDAAAGAGIPKGSLLDKWRAAAGADRARLAGRIKEFLRDAPPATGPDRALHRQLSALGGPLFGRITEFPPTPPGNGFDWGVHPSAFGKHPAKAGPVGPADLCVKAPAVTELILPADLVAGYELVTTGVLHPGSRETGSVQLRVTAAKPAADRSLQPGVPVLVGGTGPARAKMAAGLTAFRDLFPTAVCYSKIVPVDEVVTLTLYYREDHHLARLMLTDAERQRLDRLWDELHYVSRDAFSQVDAFKQLLEYASQDGDPKLFEPLRRPTMDAAAAFKQRLVDTEPQHLKAVLDFAGRAYRRPITPTERDELTGLYRKLRSQEISHDEAIRLTLARVLVAPAFLYKLEKSGLAATAAPVNDWELASRLSYFLWSSAPDAELLRSAASGELRNPDVLAAQTRRMLKDDRVRRLADEFGCQWLHVRGFEAMNEKSERHFPTFAGLRGAMAEESVRFFTDLFQADRPVSSILDSDATFLNAALAKHYGIPGVTGEQWRRIEGVRKYGRGGILGLSTTLATQAGASRTSPILRGNWVSEVLLGEKLPRPPKGVPQLPDDEAATAGLTVRQLTEKHSSDPKCAVCHQRIDAYGFSLEGYDPIGRRRDKDLAGRPIDTKAKAMDGAEFAGIDGLRDYLLTKRKAQFERQFCRKLLGYALGRSVQLSDEPLLDEMQTKTGRVADVVEAIVRSRQFREIRGNQRPVEE